MTWEEYLEKHKGRPLRPLYVKALEFVNSVPESKKVAIELGCGAGIESENLIQNGWKVYAYDKDAVAIQCTNALVESPMKNRLSLHEIGFEEILELPANHLVYSYHGLPFCDIDHFDSLMKAITDSICGGGFFVGTFFGNNDEWVLTDRALGISAQELHYHFQDFEFLHFKERDEMARTFLGEPKHWHIFEMIARKKADL